MTDSFSIEVIEGPMDGLRCCLKGKSITIGRKIGNTLRLSEDMSVSNEHAIIEKQGHSWFISDLKSTNGTFFNNKNLTNKNLIKEGQIYVFGGGTIAKIFLNKETVQNETMSNNYFDNPGQIYSMSSETKTFWNNLYKKILKIGYCDVYLILEDIFKSIKKYQSYSCTKNILSSKRWHSIGLSQEALPVYPNECDILFAPRIWRILNIASQKKWDKNYSDSGKAKKDIDIIDIIYGLLYEGRSHLCDFMKSDSYFLSDIGWKTDDTSNNQNEKNTKTKDQNTENIPKYNEKNYIILQECISKLEVTILGFLQDAINDTSPPEKFYLPGYRSRLIDMLKEQKRPDNSVIFSYVRDISEILFNMLALYKESYTENMKKMTKEIKENMENIRKKQEKVIKNKMASDIIDNVKSKLLEYKNEYFFKDYITKKINSFIKKNFKKYYNSY